MTPLTETDRRLIAALRTNARMPMTQLAQAAGV